MKDLADKYGISSPYGPRSGGFHYGIDIPTPMRSPLYAPEDGVIAFEGAIDAPVKGYPKDIIIILQLPNSFIVFAHLDQTVTDTGQRVKKGQLIGYTGNSGYSTGPHLHAEEHQGQKAANKGFLAYPSIDITPRFRGQAQGGADDVTILIRPIAMLKVHVKKQLTLYNLENGQPITGSGSYMELTGKSNIIRGASYLIPVDRMQNGEPFGFLEHEVFEHAESVHDTQFDPNPRVVELEQQTRDLTIIIDRLEAEVAQLRLDAESHRVSIEEHTKERTEAATVIEEQAKTIAQQREQLTRTQDTVEMLRSAAKNSDAISALSGIDLIRLGLRKWLGIGGGD